MRLHPLRGKKSSVENECCGYGVVEDNGSDVAPIPQGIKGEQSIDKV